MSDTSVLAAEIALIDDPHARRALRALHQEMCQAIRAQQLHIEALLDMLTDKHASTLVDFKRALLRLQQHGERAQRIEEAIATPQAPSPQPPAPPRPVRTDPTLLETDDDDSGVHRRVYRL